MMGGRLQRGFTLLELMVSVVLIAAIMGMVIAVADQVSGIWRGTASKIEQFSEARNAFDSLSRRLSQATLNAYWDYDDPNHPQRYIRRSDLRFVCKRGEAGSQELFFQAPFGYSETRKGMSGALNTWGYYVEYGDDGGTRPPFVPTRPRWRFRLMEYMEPAERFALYKDGSAWEPPSGDARKPYAHVLAENVVALVALPRLSPREDAAGTALAPKYEYNSADDGSPDTRNQLPPVVQVAVVAIDEASALRMSANDVEAVKTRLDRLFQDAGHFASDLTRSAGGDGSLEALLIARRINYHIFTTNVLLRGAKWSRP